VADAKGAALVIADPPWTYAQAIGESTADDHYRGLPVAKIAAHLHDLPAPAVAVWLTWPLLAEWTAAWSLPPTTGGAWVKSGPGDAGHYGPGHWWAGCSEPVLVYRRQGASASKLVLDRAEPLRNAWIEPPREHSRKPAAWMAQWIRRWTAPGALVVDPYAGLGSVAEAVLLAGGGRRYLGAEIDPERHASALSLLAQVRP
jgi:hypothetical protein